MTKSRETRARGLIATLCILLPLAVLAALVWGSVTLSLGESVQALGQLFQHSADKAAVIIGQIRLPRALLAALVGAMLGISGAAMQGIFRNPLADPSLIGVTAGASLGASLVIASAGSWISGLGGLTLISIGAFLGGMIAVIIVYRLANSENGTSVGKR